MKKFGLCLALLLSAFLTANAAINMSVTGLGSGLSCFGFNYTNPTQLQVFQGNQTVANPDGNGNFQVNESYKGAMLTIYATLAFCNGICGWDDGCRRQCEQSIKGQGIAKEGGIITVYCNG